MRSRILIMSLLLAVATLLQACVYVPRTTEIYDASCQIVARKMILEEVPLGNPHCANESCVGLLVGAGITATASAVVSGSIVIAGNVIYWFEKQGQCQRVT
jgi:hypothetical protein